jgi:acetyl-CoA acetyltransferase
MFDGGMSYGGAGSVCGPLLARMALEAGLAVWSCTISAWTGAAATAGPMAFITSTPAKTAFEKPVGFNGQPSYFALWARRYMHDYGLAEDDLAAIAPTRRASAIRNGRAQLQKPLSAADCGIAARRRSGSWDAALRAKRSPPTTSSPRKSIS